MRNMSFALTTQQFRDRTKDVTRRVGWKNLKPGDLVQAVEKGMGLKKGEHPVKLGIIRIVSVRREMLCTMWQYDSDKQSRSECSREGFPELDWSQFVEMFCRHNGTTPATTVTRIEFEYVR